MNGFSSTLDQLELHQTGDGLLGGKAIFVGLFGKGLVGLDNQVGFQQGNLVPQTGKEFLGLVDFNGQVVLKLVIVAAAVF